jgi:hypothetical protein
MEETNPILSKPKKLIENFFSLAEEDAKKIVEIIKQDKVFIEQVAKHVKPESFTPDDQPKIKVAVVDGSCAPIPSMKIGVGLAVISAGYLIAEGTKIVKMDYCANSFTDRQNREEFKFAVQLGMTLLERKMAVESLKENPDLLIIDGSLAFPRYPPLSVELSPVQAEIRRLTEEVVNSKKAIGIIKRSGLSAIQAELFLRGQLAWKEIRPLRDKYLMDVILPEKTVWQYSNFTANVPQSLSKTLRQLKRAGAVVTTEEFTEAYAKNYARETATQPTLMRAYMRAFKEAAPFEIEHPPGMSVINIAEKLWSLCNEATGLPIILDLLDHDVGIERTLMQAYADEVHARTLDKTTDTKTLQSLFKPLNPEKDA